MFPAASLFTTLLLAIFIAASPVEVRSPRVALPFAKRINTDGGAINLVHRDQARAAALKRRDAAIQSGELQSRGFDVPPGEVNATNQAISYFIEIGIGHPATNYSLLIDTASANTWVRADKPYTPTGYSYATNDTMSVSYGYGSVSGPERLDVLTLGSGMLLLHQSIGVATSIKGVNPNVDGFLGLGPVPLTLGTLTNNPNTQIPTITDALYAEGLCPVESVSISFAPPTEYNEANGEIIFGGTDPSKYTGEIYYTSITTTAPASNYWGINQRITYGEKTILSQNAGIIDSGTTLILIASDAYDAYKEATGATEDANTKMLKLTPSQYDKVENLNFHVYSATYSLTANGQIWPRALNSYIGGSNGVIYSVVGNLGHPSGEGLDFINGQAFIERFYVVLDTVNQQVGFATTSYTDATTN